MSLIKVCIVEDLVEVREGMVKLLEADGRFEMQGSFPDAESATLQMNVLCPDIVIMDINLPGISGIECIRQIKPICPDTQFMMFTIYEDDEKIFEALNVGASGYLLKKTPLVQMAECLVELHGGGAPMSTQIARKVINRLRSGESTTASEMLTSRENEVLQWLAKGMLYKEIAEKLSITIGTVRQHIHKIYDTLHVNNRTEAINKVYGKKY